MQTFLPYADFKQTAECLDDKRLVNQVNEALVILKTNLGSYASGGWQYHPAAKMWFGYEASLSLYRDFLIAECLRRGINRKFTMLRCLDDPFTRHPPWLGDPDFHRSHQSNLLRKNYDWYSRFFPDVPDDLPYVWPV